MKRNLLLVLIGILVLSGCGETKKNLQNEFMPVARGEIGEIILVMDSLQYKGAVGEAIRSIFRQPMKGLPQDEPLFNVSKASPANLNSVLKSAKNMVFVMTLDSKTSESKVLRNYFTDQSLNTIQRDTSQFYTVQKDLFARGQVALFLFAGSEEQLIDQLERHADQLRELFESTERRRIATRLFKKRNKNLEAVINEKYPFTLKVPFGWDQAKALDNFYWIRFLEADKEQNVFIYFEPYTTTDIFENIPSLRDKVTETFLRDPDRSDLFITRQDPPGIRAMFLERINFDGRYAIKTRGLWRYSDISGGGPYVSYTIVDEATQRLYYIEGYVYAPSTRKKNYIRELDAILSTFKIKPTDN